MQTTESRQGDNLVDTPRRGRCNSTTGSVLPKSEMSPVLVVITDVLIQQPSQVPLIENDHVIEQVPPHTANPPLRNSVLPRTPECSATRLAAHRLHGRNYSSTELGVPIEDQEALRLFAAFPSFVQLQGNPKRVGIASHVAVQDPTPVVADDKEVVQNAEGQCRHREEVHRCDRLAMITKKNQPAPGDIGRSWGLAAPSAKPLVPIDRSRAWATRHEIGALD